MIAAEKKARKGNAEPKTLTFKRREAVADLASKIDASVALVGLPPLIHAGADRFKFKIAFTPRGGAAGLIEEGYALRWLDVVMLFEAGCDPLVYHPDELTEFDMGGVKPPFASFTIGADGGFLVVPLKPGESSGEDE